MATDMARKGIYLDDQNADNLRTYSHDNKLSESAVVRKALQLFFDLEFDRSAQATRKLAKAKKVKPSTVIIAALNRIIPDKYFK